MRKLSEEQRETICSLYKNGLSSIDLATRFEVSKPTILRWLRLNNIDRRSLSEAHRKYTLDETVFSVRDEFCDYWTGFLMADGYMQMRKNKILPDAICLSLSSKDCNHLVKYATYLKTDKPIYYYKSNGHDHCRVEIISAKIFERLRQFGVTMKKSSTAYAKEGLDKSRHFWRGVIDGDGCINITGKYPRLRLVGSRLLLEQYLTFVKQFIPTRVNVNPVWKQNAERGRYITIYQVDIGSKKATDIIKLLYKDSEIYLDRKYCLAQKIIRAA